MGQSIDEQQQPLLAQVLIAGHRRTDLSLLYISGKSTALLATVGEWEQQRHLRSKYLKKCLRSAVMTCLS